MGFKNKNHILCLFILIVLSLHAPLSCLNVGKYVSFKVEPLKEEMLMVPSGMQQLPSGCSLKKPLFILKPSLKHLDFLTNATLIIACFMCLLFIRAVINKRKLVHDQCIVRLHGSKYKFFTSILNNKNKEVERNEYTKNRSTGFLRCICNWGSNPDYKVKVF